MNPTFKLDQLEHDLRAKVQEFAGSIPGELSLPPEPFKRGAVYRADYVARVVHPCTVRKFMNAVGVRWLAPGLLSGDAICDGLERNADTLAAMAINLPKTAVNAPRSALEPISVQTILEQRQRLQ